MSAHSSKFWGIIGTTQRPWASQVLSTTAGHVGQHLLAALAALHAHHRPVGAAGAVGHPGLGHCCRPCTVRCRRCCSRSPSTQKPLRHSAAGPADGAVGLVAGRIRRARPGRRPAAACRASGRRRRRLRGVAGVGAGVPAAVHGTAAAAGAGAARSRQRCRPLPPVGGGAAAAAPSAAAPATAAAGRRCRRAPGRARRRTWIGRPPLAAAPPRRRTRGATFQKTKSGSLLKPPHPQTTGQILHARPHLSTFIRAAAAVSQVLRHRRDTVDFLTVAFQGLGGDQTRVSQQRLGAGRAPAEISKHLAGVAAAAQREHGVAEAPAGAGQRRGIVEARLLEGGEGVGATAPRPTCSCSSRRRSHRRRCARSRRGSDPRAAAASTVFSAATRRCTRQHVVARRDRSGGAARDPAWRSTAGAGTATRPGRCGRRTILSNSSRGQRLAGLVVAGERQQGGAVVAPVLHELAGQLDRVPLDVVAAGGVRRRRPWSACAAGRARTRGTASPPRGRSSATACRPPGGAWLQTT